MTRFDDLEAQVDALSVRYPYCDVELDEVCVNLRTGERLRASHWQRISAARGPVQNRHDA